MSHDNTLRVAVLGSGTVGTEVIRLLGEQAEDLTARTGATLKVIGIAVRDRSRPRDPVVAPELLTDDAEGLVRQADVVIELIGGIQPARDLLHTAFASGASVVTANKALLAVHGPELYEAAEANGVDIYYEAAVAGAVPVVRGVRESLAGDRVTRITGVVNGTTNYILDEMTNRGLGFDEALAQAQALGFAEADPSSDVDGDDAAAKIAILASLAFHSRVPIEQVHVAGIRSIQSVDVTAARDADHVIKLLAVAEHRRNGEQEGIWVQVEPALVPSEHPLANVHGAFNAVMVEADAAGRLMFYGQGAGGAPTASAVLGDVVAAARHRVSGGTGPRETSYAALPMLTDTEAKYQLRVLVSDVPGVLARVAGTLGEHGVSISTVRQAQLLPNDGLAEIIIVTHRARSSALAATTEALTALEPVERLLATIRVEEV